MRKRERESERYTTFLHKDRDRANVALLLIFLTKGPQSVTDALIRGTGMCVSVLSKNK